MAERGKPVEFQPPQGLDSESQETPMIQLVKDVRESEGSAVMVEIRAAITRHESEPTSDRC